MDLEKGLVEFLPKEDWFRDDRGSWDGTVYQIAPYSSALFVAKTIAERHIKVPFDKIILRTEGKSVCPHCKAVYVGFQPKCTQKVTYWKAADDRYFSKGEAFVGETKKIKDNLYTKRVTTTELQYCDTNLIWDRDKEFREQENFFSFVAWLSGISVEQTNGLSTYAKYLPPGAAAEYRILHLEQQLQQTNFELNRCVNGLRMIAEKNEPSRPFTYLLGVL